MSAAGDLRAHQSRFGVEGFGIDFFQLLTADVIVAVAGGSGKAVGTDLVNLHGVKDLGLVVFCHLINVGEAFLQTGENFFTVFINLLGHAQLFIHGVHGYSSFEIRFYACLKSY